MLVDVLNNYPPRPTQILWRINEGTEKRLLEFQDVLAYKQVLAFGYFIILFKSGGKWSRIYLKVNMQARNLQVDIYFISVANASMCLCLSEVCTFD